MKKTARDRFWMLLLLLSIAAQSAVAQQAFKYKAVIGKVDSPGFYRIDLQPQLVAKCQESFADLRIADSKKTFVPYVLSGELPPGKQTEFVAFPAKSPGIQPDTTTTLVFENTENLNIRALWLRLKNTAVSRTVNLSGSDDLNRWFAIKENIPLQQANDEADGSYLQSFSFPASTYHYFKIMVNDARKMPISILRAGVFVEHAAPVQFTALPGAVISQTDSAKESWVSIRFNDHYQLNKLQLDIAGPRFFKREVYIYTVKGSMKTLVDEEELNSGKPTDLLLSTKTNHIELQIINEDNPPLYIRKISGFENRQYVISYLEPGKKYYFEFGNSLAGKPLYDLRFFTDSLNHYIKQLTHQEITINNTNQSDKASKIDRHTIIIWASILTALFLLSILTVKMTAEVKKRTNQ